MKIPRKSGVLLALCAFQNEVINGCYIKRDQIISSTVKPKQNIFRFSSGMCERICLNFVPLFEQILITSNMVWYPGNKLVNWDLVENWRYISKFRSESLFSGTFRAKIFIPIFVWFCSHALEQNQEPRCLILAVVDFEFWYSGTTQFKRKYGRI